MTKQELGRVIAVFVTWRMMLFVIGALAPLWFRYDPSFPYYDSLLAASGLPQWLYSWANFDGVHQITIVTKGYVGTALIQAFFPVLPLVTAALNMVVGSPIVSGLLVANVFAGIFCSLWFWLLKKVWGTSTAWWGLMLLLAFPTSFFVGAFYSESLFLSFVVGAMLAGLYKKWWLAGILAALASATRVVGIVAVPMLLLMLVESQLKNPVTASVKDWQIAFIKTVRDSKTATMWIVAGSLGLIAYMVYLHIEFQDPLYFFHVQAEFGGIRQESLVFYPQVVWRSLKVLLTVKPITWQYLTYIQEFIVGVFGLIGILLSYKKVRLSWVFFSLVVFLIPTVTGTFSSLPRYILASLSLFMWLPLVLRTRPWVLGVYLICSSLLLLINLALFIQGYWVA